MTGRFQRLLASLTVLATAWAGAPARAGTAPTPPVRPPATATPATQTPYYYSTYTTYGSNITWSTCGRSTTSSGCYGSGSIGPFSRACAVVGAGSRLAVVDAGPVGSTQSTLSIYARVESDAPSLTLLKTITLPIAATAKASCHAGLAGNFLYFGTNQSPTYYKIDLTTYGMFSGGICGGATSAISVSDKAVAVSQSNCYAVFDLNGTMQADGGQSSDTFVAGNDAVTP